MRADVRLAVPALAGWVTAAVLIGVPGTAVVALIAAWLVSGALVFVRPKWALAALGVAVCATAVVLHEPARSPEYLRDAADASRNITVTATVTQPGADPWEGSIDGVPALFFGEPPTTGIGATVSVTGTPQKTEVGDDRAFLVFVDEVELVAPPPAHLDWANQLRAGFLIATEELPGPGGDLLPGLAIGDTSAVGDELDAAMKTSSLSHLTAVSGANCAIVVGLVMLVGGALGLPRAVRIGASAIALVGFVVLVTPDPSVLRAGVMAVLVLAAVAMGRPARGTPLLALAVLGLLVLDPWLARNLGFVLSVAATAALLLLASPLAERLERWMPRWLALVIAVPVAAQVACQPFIVLLDASLPTYGVVANVLAAPAAPVATVVGLAAVVTVALAPPLGSVLCHVAWVPAAWIAAVAEFFDTAPAPRLPWAEGPLGVLTLAAVGALIVAALRWRAAAVALCVVVAVYLGLAAGGVIAARWSRPPDWQIALCDVGQGDASVVRSAGTVAVIDTGPDPGLLRECLTDLGIGRVDLLVLSHFDLDHVGGTSAVIGRVGEVLVGPRGSADDEQLVADLTAGGAAVRSVAAGASGILGDHRWTVHWPSPRTADAGNDASVVVRFDPVGRCPEGCVGSLFLGDLGQEPQDALPAAALAPGIDVVKVSHHGSADQSTTLYGQVGAVVGLIGVGEGNGYGHPTDELLALLEAAGTSARRSDRDGLVLVAPGSHAGSVTVWSER